MAFESGVNNAMCHRQQNVVLDKTVLTRRAKQLILLNILTPRASDNTLIPSPAMPFIKGGRRTAVSVLHSSHFSLEIPCVRFIKILGNWIGQPFSLQESMNTLMARFCLSTSYAVARHLCSLTVMGRRSSRQSPRVSSPMITSNVTHLPAMHNTFVELVRTRADKKPCMVDVTMNLTGFSV